MKSEGVTFFVQLRSRPSHSIDAISGCGFWVLVLNITGLVARRTVFSTRNWVSRPKFTCARDEWRPISSRVIVSARHKSTHPVIDRKNEKNAIKTIGSVVACHLSGPKSQNACARGLQARCQADHKTGPRRYPITPRSQSLGSQESGLTRCAHRIDKD